MAFYRLIDPDGAQALARGNAFFRDNARLGRQRRYGSLRFERIERRAHQCALAFAIALGASAARNSYARLQLAFGKDFRTPPSFSIRWNSLHAASHSVSVRASMLPDPAAGSATKSMWLSPAMTNRVLRATRRAN